MAYICNKTIKCNKCTHYRYDDDSDGYACFAEQDRKNITVRSLTEKDTKQVKELDDMANYCVADGLDSENYVHGIFQGNKLIGYCTVGYADVDPVYCSHPAYANNSTLLSDVYVRPDYRRHGYASDLINAVLAKQTASIFLTLLDPNLVSFYEKFGFKLYDGASWTMIKE